MSKQKITFESEGLKVVGNLFRPQNAKEQMSLPAVLVAGAMTGLRNKLLVVTQNASLKLALLLLY
jgi:hypothetical protein